MLERLYIDNYKCFVNFTFRPAALHLLMGRNGSGKSSLGRALEALRSVISGAALDSEFGHNTFNRWLAKPTQTIEVDVRLSGKLFRYSLQIEHQANRRLDEPRLPRVLRETLEMDNRTLLDFAEGRLSLFKERAASAPLDFRFDWHRSALTFLQPRAENEDIFVFKRWVEQISYFQLKPPFAATAESEAVRPHPNLANFTAWIRFKLQDDPAIYARVQDVLRQVMPGFRTLRLQTMDDGRKAQVAEFEADGTMRAFELGELSDGQQALLGLYFLLYGWMEAGRLVIFDEPDSFVALREIQPWMTKLLDLAEDTKTQAFVISHHPEILNLLAPDHGIVFARLASGWIQAEPYDPKDADLLTPAELEARGW